MARSLIIGGNGFIGVHLAERLLNCRESVTVLDVRGRTSVDKRIRQVISSDLVEEDSGQFANEFDEVVDLAYTSTPKTSFENPLKDIIENLQSTVSTFSLFCQSNRLKKFIYVSSGGTVYGNSANSLLTESDPTNPISPYGITKLAIEKYGLMFFNQRKFPIVIARPANAYGPGQAANRGQGFISQALYNTLIDEPVPIFGISGTVRDYVFVEDIVGAIVALLDKGQPGEIYNIGSEKGYSNLAILDMIRQLAISDGLRVRINEMPYRDFDVKSNVLSSGKILLQCGWKSSTDIMSGLRGSYEYMKNNVHQ
jgi:UDP-glucose 4-epimerase